MNEQIALQPLQVNDAPRLFELINTNRPQLKKFWWEAQTQTVADSERFITDVNRLETENGAPTRGIHIGNKLFGVAALHTIDWQFRTSLLGFWMDKDQGGHGYGTQVVHELAALAFDIMDLNELRISTRASNAASCKVAENAGFTLQHIQDEHLWQTEEQLIPTATYALDAADYTIARNQQISQTQRPETV